MGNESWGLEIITDPVIPAGAFAFGDVSSMLVKVPEGKCMVNGVERPLGVWGVTNDLATSPIVRDRYRPDPLIEGIRSLFGFPSETNKRKTNMATRQALQALIDRTSERLERLSRFPDKETYPLGTIIGFDVRFDTGPKVYHYAAVKSEKGWHLTGRNTGFWSWDELVFWLAEEVECVAMVVVSEVEELIEPTELGDAYGEADTTEKAE